MVVNKNYNSKGRKAKRWYFGATASLPIVGKTGIEFGSGTKTKRSLGKLVDKRILSHAESKRKIIDNSGVVDPFHNTVYTQNPLGNIPQGSQIFARTGDEIHVNWIKYVFHFYNKNVVQNQKMRVMFVSADQEVRGSADSFGTGLTTGDIFMNYYDPLISIPDFKKVTVLHDEIVSIPGQTVTGQRTGVVKEFKFSLNRTHSYRTGSSYKNGKNYYLVVIPHIEEGITGTTRAGNWDCQIMISYKDM